MKHLGDFLKSVIRFLALWVVDGISLLVVAWVLPGVRFTPAAVGDRLMVALEAAFVLSLVNLLIRPLILMIARPLGFIAVFVIGFLVNAIALLVTAWLVPGFELDGVLAAVVGGLVFAAINVILTSILDVNEEGSLYQNLIERQAKGDSYAAPADAGRGLVMVEIDGLSYHHLRHALNTGQLPFLQRLIVERGYVLSRADCGIPSQTSACQAGIMFGDNYDIPAYRWYDKDKQKLYVSASDAQEINARYAEGNGLMRHGSSISNMMDGDAAKSLLTLANLKTTDATEKKRRAQDIYLLMLNPYFFMRTLALFLGEVVRELWQGGQQVRKDVQPRLNRLHAFYPFVRAGTTTLVRELGTNLTILDIVRGAPAIYFTWPGYDEVAHHSGPWTSDAFGVIHKFDRNLERIYRAAKERAPRPYDVIVLSDHGQSFGATFQQRYGLSLKEFIEQRLPSGVVVSQLVGGDTGLGSLTAVGAELENLEEAAGNNAMSRGVARQGQRLIAKGTQERRAVEGADGAAAPGGAQPQVLAYGSGNLAQVYFDLLPRKMTLNELNAAYPGMVDALVQHPGIGLVCGYEDDGAPVCLGKGGTRNLHTGQVQGADPVKMYAPEDPKAYGSNTIETRVWQIRRVMDFPHAGDLMVISTVYLDGTVAALEELIGSHGGLGGEQTDAFLLHPGTIQVPEVRNSADVFGVLNARRGQPVTAEERAAEAAVMTERVDEWSLANLWAGVTNVKKWVPLALRGLVLDRSAYREVANDPHMTGPGLLVGIIFSLFSASIVTGGLNGVSFSALSVIGGWLVSTMAVYLAGRVLTRRGYYTRTMRTLGFARVLNVVSLLALIPQAQGIVLLLYLAFTFVALWIASSEAHAIRGWRSVSLPILGVLLSAIIPLLLVVLFTTATVGVANVLRQLGLIAAP
jgi:uncharacterized membrane protein YvlD (DUF360 family)